MERERAKPLEGRVARLILLVVVSVMCVVFCVLCSNRRPDDCTFFPGAFFSSFQLTARLLYFFSGCNFFLIGVRVG